MKRVEKGRSSKPAKTEKSGKSQPKNQKGSNPNLIAAIATPIVVIALCVLVYSFFTQSWWFTPNVVKEKPTAHFDNTPLFTLENYPRIDGSTATIPLNLAFKSNFTGEKIDENSITFSQTDKAYTQLINGETDLILVTSPSEDELARAAAANVELEVTPVVNEGFIFFVNKNNPVDNLTSEQVKQIYEGKITNWKEVGGNDEPIAAYQRPVNSGSQTGMIDLVMKDRQLVPAPTTMIAGTMADIINIVASYSNNPGAIGYSYYFYATTMYRDENAAAANNIKLLKIDGVAPNSESIRTGQYPFRTAYYIVINKAAESDSSTRKLQEAMLSPRGQAVAAEAGYVPVN
ncbi:substrate-binding domain-containing protein [Candidatus Saccharibacteria bacterium]|nr:substrate-binding domain-containing protein [Candidatus Saccharibacteria bacterium]